MYKTKKAVPRHKKPKHKLNLLVAKFQAYMETQNYSDRTITDYGYQLGYFITYLENNNITEITDISSDIIYNYQIY